MKSEFWQRWGVLVVLILIFPLTILLPKSGIINPYIDLVLKYIGINIILTISLNLEDTGDFHGHAGFMAIGAYTASLLTVWLFPGSWALFPHSGGWNRGWHRGIGDCFSFVPHARRLSGDRDPGI
jgi:ABC-type branched-subunit amino acid transport system permease subunit